MSHPHPAVSSTADAYDDWQPHAAEEFQRVGGVGTAAIALLFTSTLTHLLVTWADWNTYSAVSQFLGDGADVDMAILNRADTFSRLTSVPNVVVSVAAAVVFVIWLWRARVNSEVFCQADHRRGHGWVLASWFCPGPNLWFPKQIVDDVWLASDPKTPVYADDLRRFRTPPVTQVWWIAWVGALAFDVVVRRLLMWMDPTVGTLRGIALTGTASLLLTAVAAVGATVVIRSINTMQTGREWIPWWDQREPKLTAVPTYAAGDTSEQTAVSSATRIGRRGETPRPGPRGVVPGADGPFGPPAGSPTGSPYDAPAARSAPADADGPVPGSPFAPAGGRSGDGFDPAATMALGTAPAFGSAPDSVDPAATMAFGTAPAFGPAADSFGPAAGDGFGAAPGQGSFGSPADDTFVGGSDGGRNPFAAGPGESPSGRTYGSEPANPFGPPAGSPFERDRDDNPGASAATGRYGSTGDDTMPGTSPFAADPSYGSAPAADSPFGAPSAGAGGYGSGPAEGLYGSGPADDRYGSSSYGAGTTGDSLFSSGGDSGSRYDSAGGGSFGSTGDTYRSGSPFGSDSAPTGPADDGSSFGRASGDSLPDAGYGRSDDSRLGTGAADGWRPADDSYGSPVSSYDSSASLGSPATPSWAEEALAAPAPRDLHPAEGGPPSQQFAPIESWRDETAGAAAYEPAASALDAPSWSSYDQPETGDDLLAAPRPSWQAETVAPASLTAAEQPDPYSYQPDWSTGPSSAPDYLPPSAPAPEPTPAPAGRRAARVAVDSPSTVQPAASYSAYGEDDYAPASYSESPTGDSGSAYDGYPPASSSYSADSYGYAPRSEYSEPASYGSTDYGYQSDTDYGYAPSYAPEPYHGYQAEEPQQSPYSYEPAEPAYDTRPAADHDADAETGDQPAPRTHPRRRWV